jgi:rod shape determining protein RodA
MSLFSVGYGRGEGPFRKQLINAVIGLGPLSLFYFVKPEFWRKISNWLYLVSVGLLASVLALGFRAGGAKRWIEVGPLQFQPSELVKLLMVLTLATFYAKRQDQVDKLSTFLWSIAHMALPIAMLLKQPHLGGALVLLVIWLCVSVVSNVRLRFIVGALGLVGLLIAGAWTIPGILRPYHRERVMAMFTTDEQDEDYQVFRAQLAFGVGGVSGTGFLRGEQKSGGYIPEQHNDFIITVLGEEGGLVGCGMLLAAYAFFFYRIWLIMRHADDVYYRMITAGIFGLLAFHTVVNLGMVLQLLPVVGLWLPFMSAGGSAIWLCLACVGLLLNIRGRERPVLF